MNFTFTFQNCRTGSEASRVSMSKCNSRSGAFEEPKELPLFHEMGERWHPNRRANKFVNPPWPSPRTPHCAINHQLSTINQFALRTGFTLIELLVVIAIIGLLAGLILGTASIASAKKTQTRVSAERDALITAIESYKKDKGYYPPDNTNDPTCIQTPLFYELTGTKVVSAAGTSTFQSPVSGETLTQQQVSGLFPGLGGFMNASGDPSSPAKDYYPGLKATQHLIVVGSTPSGSVNFTVFGVPASGPTNLNPALSGGGSQINPWHYNYSHPTNNPNSFDLWMDVKYGGKTNRFSNWSEGPTPIAY